MLRPLQRSDYYPIEFTDAQWAQLVAAFPTGVCDFSQPGVSQQPAISWQTYQDAAGNVIYGGTPLGPAPGSEAFDPSVTAPGQTNGAGSGATGTGTEASTATATADDGVAAAPQQKQKKELKKKRRHKRR